MPAHDLADTSLESGEVHVSRDTHGRANIVRSRRTLKLIEKPETLLRKRQWRSSGPRHWSQGCRLPVERVS